MPNTYTFEPWPGSDNIAPGFPVGNLSLESLDSAQNRGGLGKVYRLQGGRLALKKFLGALREGVLASPDYEAFLEQTARNEFKVTRALAGSKVVPEAYAVGTLQEPYDLHHPAMVESFVLGTSLKSSVQSGDLAASGTNRPDPLVVLTVMEDVAKALAEVHDRGICHRDLSPANIMVPSNCYLAVSDEDGLGSLVTIIDFGSGTFSGEADFNGGVWAQTPFGAPEMFGGPYYARRADPSVDVWSLGALLWCLVAGYDAFPEEVRLYDWVHRGWDPLVEIKSFGLSFDTPETRECLATYGDAAPAVEKLVAQCTEFDPARRPTATEVVSALHACLTTLRASRTEFEGVTSGATPALPTQEARINEALHRGLTAYANREYDRAFPDLLHAAEADSVEAMVPLAMSYVAGFGTSRNPTEAFRWFSVAAEEGSLKAINGMGYCYDTGTGTSKNEDEACRWWQRGADEGDAICENNLGMFYYRQGEYSKAYPWLLGAANQGVAAAQYQVGRMFWRGEGVPMDNEQAFLWCQAAAEQCFVQALTILGVLYWGGMGVVKNEDAAVRCWKEAVSGGDYTAADWLGKYYENESGISMQTDFSPLKQVMSMGGSSETIPKKQPNWEEAARWYKLAAQHGVAHAQYRLGVFYHSGRGVQKDKEQTRFWWRKAAEQGYRPATNVSDVPEMARENLRRSIGLACAAEEGDAASQDALATAYATGEFGDKDDAKAAFWWRKAAEQGYAWAQLNLWRVYREGVGVEKNGKEALLWLLEATKQGVENPDALYELGCLYKEGDGVPQSTSKALGLWCKAAEQGQAAAQNKVGWAYHAGDGVAQDDAKAAWWFRLSAEQGDADGLCNLGVAYHFGKGVQRDDAEAVRLWKRSALTGHAEAESRLGYAYSKGLGVAQSDERAVFWWIKSAKTNVTSQQNLGWAYQFGRGVERDYILAAEWYRKAAQRGSAYAQNALGVLYSEGKGVPHDDAEAVRWWQKAASNNYPYALYNLGCAYFEGKGVQKDPAEAVRMWQLAAKQGHREARQQLHKNWPNTFGE